VVDLRSPSLFGGLRLVVVHDVAALPEPILTALTDYARHPLAEVFLAVVAAPTTPRKLLDALAKEGADLVRPARPSDRQKGAPSCTMRPAARGHARGPSSRRTPRGGGH